MQAHLIDMENRPGELARVTEALGENGINITGITGSTIGDRGRIALVTSDEAGTDAALGTAGYSCTHAEVVEMTMADQPGELGRAARRLADAGVNIEALLPLGMSGGNVTAGFVTDNAEKAREVLTGASAAR
jgi:hypothetical protein